MKLVCQWKPSVGGNQFDNWTAAGINKFKWLESVSGKPIKLFSPFNQISCFHFSMLRIWWLQDTISSICVLVFIYLYMVQNCIKNLGLNLFQTFHVEQCPRKNNWKSPLFYWISISWRLLMCQHFPELLPLKFII